MRAMVIVISVTSVSLAIVTIINVVGPVALFVSSFADVADWCSCMCSEIASV